MKICLIVCLLLVATITQSTQRQKPFIDVQPASQETQASRGKIQPAKNMDQQTRITPKSGKNPFERPKYNPKPQIDQSLNPFGEYGRMDDQNFQRMNKRRRDHERRRKRQDRNPKIKQDTDNEAQSLINNNIVFASICALAILFLIRICKKQNKRARRQMKQQRQTQIYIECQNIDESIRYHQTQIHQLRNKTAVATQITQPQE